LRRGKTEGIRGKKVDLIYIREQRGEDIGAGAILKRGGSRKGRWKEGGTPKPTPPPKRRTGTKRGVGGDESRRREEEQGEREVGESRDRGGVGT